MQLNQVLKVINHTFASGGPFLWTCYGEDAMYIDFKTINNVPVGSILFDTSTAEVYEITAEIPDEELSYRWISSDFREEFYAESISKGFDPSIAWDKVRFVDVEIEEDILEKVEAIVNGREFDRSVSVQLEFTEEEELELHRQAHKAGITTNEYVNMALRSQIDILKKEKDRLLDDRYIR